MIIHCADFEAFMDVVYDLLKKGVMFEAHTKNLEINLTGGF